MGLKDIPHIKEYVPTILKDVKEIEALCNSGEVLFDNLNKTLEKESSRQTIQNSDEEGVRRHEAIMGVTPDPSIEPLDFRKERLLARSNSTLPYTTIWLRNYLNSVLGASNYELEVDYKDLIIKLYGFILDSNWSKEANKTISQAKPCNVIFLNIPTLIQSLELQSWLDNGTWGSDLWNDDNFWNDFRILTKQELINYEKETDGVNLELLLSQTNGVRLNKSVVITDFTHEIKDNTLYITISVPQDIELVTYVELISGGDTSILGMETQLNTNTDSQITFRLSTYKRK